jgi:hypothetical protein
LHDRACCSVKFASQPSHRFGKSGGVMPYRISKASQNSWRESSVPLTTVEGGTESPRSCPFRSLDNPAPRWHFSIFLVVGGRSFRIESCLSWDSTKLLARNAILPAFIMVAVLSSCLNSVGPLNIARTRCPKITSDALWFDSAVVVGFGIARPANKMKTYRYPCRYCSYKYGS